MPVIKQTVYIVLGIFSGFSQIHTKDLNTLCVQKVELVNFIHGGKYSILWNLNG